MRALAVMAALIMAAAALPPVPSLAQEVAPAQLDPWLGTLYDDFGLNLFYPTGHRPSARRSAETVETGETLRTLAVNIPLAAGGAFTAHAFSLGGTGELDPEMVLLSYTIDPDVTRVEEVWAASGRAWEFDTIENKRPVRHHLVVVERRWYHLQSVSGPAGALDPRTRKFFHSAMITPARAPSSGW